MGDVIDFNARASSRPNLRTAFAAELAKSLKSEGVDRQDVAEWVAKEFEASWAKLNAMFLFTVNPQVPSDATEREQRIAAEAVSQVVAQVSAQTKALNSAMGKELARMAHAACFFTAISMRA